MKQLVLTYFHTFPFYDGDAALRCVFVIFTQNRQITPVVITQMMCYNDF